MNQIFGSVREIKSALLRFHRERGYQIFESFPLISDDPTVMFTNAAITPFKHWYTDHSKGLQNYAIIQRCFRMGGASELDCVGVDPYCHTFFEMFGSGTFGINHQKAIQYLFELLDSLTIEREHLYFTIPDDVRFKDSLLRENIRQDQISTLYSNEFFWQEWGFGKLGPVGKGLTVIYSRTKKTPQSLDEITANPDQFIELLNLIHVYGQEKENGQIVPLANPGFDLGVGIERLAAVVQECNNFQIDTMKPLIDIVFGFFNYQNSIDEVTIRILTDHLRAICVLVNEGVKLSNKKCGYVLRKLVKRFVELFWASAGCQFPSETQIRIFSHELEQSGIGIESHDAIVDVIGQESRALCKVIQKSRSILERQPDIDINILWDTYGISPTITKNIKGERRRRMKMNSAEIRKLFLKYFSGNNHLIIGSASLVPINDPTLLIINSGMAPLKKYFTAEEHPPQPCLCNIQKCVRVNDLESVGDRHHLTFFEMMGNWSIGDYFKKEAITLAWKMINNVFGFDTDRIFATVYGGDPSLPNIPPDDESREIWSELIPSNHIITLDAHSNFWGPAGESGPCGPCTEIFIDRGEKYGCGQITCGLGCECGRFLEIWNAGVFMQYYLHGNNIFTELPLKSVDAGAGLDRFAVILQEVDSVYETDLLLPIIEVISSGSNFDAKSKPARIITDHIRCATFMIADGIYPANTKREYIVRLILRRALLYAHLSGLNWNRLLMASNTVINLFSDYYPELETNRSAIQATISHESETFAKTMRRGLKEFDKIISRSHGLILGEDVFKLHDTHGLSIDLTRELAKEQGLQIDEEGFRLRLEEQRKRSH